jgi:hypothetical protein
MPLAAQVTMAVAAMTATSSARHFWVAAMGYSREKLALIDFTAHVLGVPDAPPDPSHRHLHRAV